MYGNICVEDFTSTNSCELKAFKKMVTKVSEDTKNSINVFNSIVGKIIREDETKHDEENKKNRFLFV